MYATPSSKSSRSSRDLRWADLFLPVSDGLEGGAVHGGKGEDARLGAAVVGLGDGVKLLLTGRVPEHQPHRIVVHPATGRSTRCTSNTCYHTVSNNIIRSRKKSY